MQVGPLLRVHVVEAWWSMPIRADCSMQLALVLADEIHHTALVQVCPHACREG